MHFRFIFNEQNKKIVLLPLITLIAAFILNMSTFTEESLYFYTVLVKYRELVVFQGNYDLKSPIRIFYGNGFEQTISVVGHCDIPVFPKLFEATPVELPKYTG